MAVVCLITPGQPSTNPRLVKEADALVAAGHEVHVVCAHWARWADETDRQLLQSRSITCTYVGGRPGTTSHLWTRIRHRAGRELVRLPIGPAASNWALCRVTPELTRAAEQVKADLYIAHNLGALPAAWSAARRHGGKLGFDAEDFHSGMMSRSTSDSQETVLTDRLETSILPQCDYITAAAPLIADRYALKYSIARPRTVLNVFSLRDRPATFRSSGHDGALRVCWFSQTIGRGRGIEDVVRAMAWVAELDIELHLLGDWQTGFRDELSALAHSAGLPPARIKSHDPVPPDGIVAWAAHYDVGLAGEQPDSLNRNICLSNKIFTYLAAGNAIVATSTDGQKRLMEQIPGAGLYYAPGDAAVLASQLRAWYSDRAALNSVRHRAWNYGSSRYNWEVEKVGFLNIVEHVLSSSARSVA